MATIQVNDAAGFTAALRGAQGGDVIMLAPGTYSDFVVKGLNPKFDVPVTITSADAANPAALTDFALAGVKGLTFRNLDFVALTPEDPATSKNWSFKFRDSSDITFDQVRVHGTLDGDPSNDSFGIQFRDSQNVTITNSEFQQLGRALAVGATDNVVVSGNYVHDLRSDGLDFAQVSNVQIVGNTLKNFFPAKGDHPDAIQFWTSGTKTASHDILISHNVIQKGEGAGTQGIFLRDQIGTMPYERVTISDNLVLGTGYNAIRLQGVKDLTLTRNELVTFEGDYKSFLLIQGGDGVYAEGNRAVSISFGDSVNVTQRGNVTTDAVNDLGGAAIRSWIDANPASAAAIQGHLPVGFELEIPTIPAVPAVWVDPTDILSDVRLSLDVGLPLFRNYDFL
jgi:hypothetical protein